jgi:molybdenum cofactor sulfurtransferase
LHANTDCMMVEALNSCPTTNTTSLLDQLRNEEYSRLDEQQHVYLDYTGGSLYSSKQIEAHHQFLKKQVLGNPHSTNPTSLRATEFVEATRKYVLSYFQATEDYYCVFTPNASGALKIVGESYPFNNNSAFVLTFDNHNSVNGIREFAKQKGAAVSYCPVFVEDLRMNEPCMMSLLQQYNVKKNKLLAFPAQSNVSGVKHPLSLIDTAVKQGWDVLLDAAAFVPTNQLSLQQVKPHFVSVSFYKIFGYPTGLGCLLIRKDAISKLQKPWFAGGTVSLVSVLANNHFLADAHERFEEGTVNYLDIPAIKTGLEHIEKTGIHTIHQNVTALTGLLLEELQQLKHKNGVPLIHILGPQNNEQRGGTILMNFFNSKNELIPFQQVEEKANAQNISLRTGCFCNPGIDEINNCLNTNELIQYFSTRSQGNYHDMIHQLGKLRGAVRVSLGIVSNRQDVIAFVNFAQQFLQ